MGTAAAAAGGLTTSVGAQQTGVTLTDAQINASLLRLNTQYDGINNTQGLVAVRRAPDAQADNYGQYGINLSGYLDDIGTGLEWVCTLITRIVILQELECWLFKMDTHQLFTHYLRLKMQTKIIQMLL